MDPRLALAHQLTLVPLPTAGPNAPLTRNVPATERASTKSAEIPVLAHVVAMQSAVSLTIHLYVLAQSMTLEIHSPTAIQSLLHVRITCLGPSLAL